MGGIFVACLLILPCMCHGLFLDTMMSDCHGIPFMCNLKKKGDYSNQGSINPFMTGTFPGTGSSNNMQSQPGVLNPGAMADHIGYNSGSNPADMTSVVSQDGKGVKNPFYQTQQNMMSGDLAVSMQQSMSGAADQGGGERDPGQEGVSMFGPGMVSGPNHAQYGPSGMSGNAMGGFPGSLGSMTASGQGGLTSGGQGQGPQGMGGFPGSSGVGGRFPGGSASVPGGSVDEGAKTTATPIFTGDVIDGICDVSWTRCKQKCITEDPATGCPVCSCKMESQQQHEISVQEHVPPTKDDQSHTCRPYPADCPRNCVDFDDQGCTVCSCKQYSCPAFPNDCPRGHSMIDTTGCPICTVQDGQVDSSWYQGIWE